MSLFDDGRNVRPGWHDRKFETNPVFLTASAMATRTQKVGQIWYIKAPGSLYEVREVVITDITEKTVQFDGWPIRYEISDIKFIELVKDA